MTLPKCAMCGSKNSRFIKNQEAKGLFSNLGLKTPLNKDPILGDVLFWSASLKYKMNENVNRFLLAGDKFMPEMHVKQPGFTYSACGPFTINKERIPKFRETGDTNYIYKNELDKTCFQHGMAYGDFKDLARRTASDKVLREKTFNIAKNRKCDGYQSGLASMVYKSFDKEFVGSGINRHANDEHPLDLTEELHKPITRKF